MNNQNQEPKSYENLLAVADELIHGARPEDYSHPLDDFSVTAAFWTTWGRARGILTAETAFTPEDVSIMMVLMKLSRESRKHLHDNLLDISGYIGCNGRCIAERERRDWGPPYTNENRPGPVCSTSTNER